MSSFLTLKEVTVKEKAVETKLSGAETAEQALALLKKHYDSATVVQMLNRGEYDVIYRKSRQVVTSAQRKTMKVRLDELEKAYVRGGGDLSKLEAQIKSKS
jgi:hypothetical protein